MGETEEYVMKVLASADDAQKNQLMQMLHQPLFQMYMLDGPVVQMCHRIFMRTIFDNRVHLRELMQEDHDRRIAEQEKQELKVTEVDGEPVEIPSDGEEE